MSRLLVLYHSYDAQTARIAQRIHEALAKEGVPATLQPFDRPGAFDIIGRYDAVVLGGAVRYGHHDPKLEEAVRRNAAVLAARPNAFYSVSLSAGGPGANPAEAARYVDEFRRKTGWTPQATATFAGALRYSRYNVFMRFVMRMISRKVGKPTDTSRDYEYTDWAAVDRFARDFARRLAADTLPHAA